MGLIVLPSSNAGSSKARLGYENHMETATSVVASSEDAAFPVANCYDWLTCDFFKPAASGTVNIVVTLPAPASADYFAFYNQDLYSHSGTIKLQYWDGAAYQDCFSAISPVGNAPVFKVFPSKTSSLWRIVITSDAVFSLGVVSFGNQLILQHGMYLGWAPPSLARDTKLVTSTSDGGAFLGRSVIAKGIRTDLILQYATDSWVRTYWKAFVEHAEQKPFFFVPNIVDFPGEAALCWVQDSISPPQHTHYGYMGASIPVKGLIE